MLESCVQGAQTHLTIPTQKFFNKLSILINLIFLLEHAKNQAVSSFCCRDTVNFKILKSDWLIKFFQTWDLCRMIGNNINFDYGLNSGKINNQIFQ